jgi:hypothetical protein
MNRSVGESEIPRRHGPKDSRPGRRRERRPEDVRMPTVFAPEAASARARKQVYS